MDSVKAEYRNLQNSLFQPPVSPPFPFANTSFPQRRQQSLYLPAPSSCLSVAGFPTLIPPGALQRRSFSTPSVETSVPKIKKAETHVNLPAWKPRFQSDPPTHLLGDLGQAPAISKPQLPHLSNGVITRERGGSGEQPTGSLWRDPGHPDT